jgi:hypothetical protein
MRLVSSCMLALGVVAAPARGQVPPALDSALTRALLVRGEADQAVRDSMVRRLQTGQPVDSAFAQRMLALDSANTAWLCHVVHERGWPGRSLVGPEAAEAAFLIVQHAPDTAFQAEVLALIERGAAQGEVPGANVALLADRVAVHRGQPQRYGTQAKLVAGRVLFEPIADSAHVDARRRRLGLMPLRAYARLLDSVYTAAPSSPPAAPN